MVRRLSTLNLNKDIKTTDTPEKESKRSLKEKVGQFKDYKNCVKDVERRYDHNHGACESENQRNEALF